MNIPTNPPPRVNNDGMSRREALLKGLGLAALAGASFGTVRLLAGSKKKQVEDAIAVTPIPPELAQISMKDFFEKLKKSHPEIIQNPYLLFTIEEQEVYWFLERCSLNDLKQLGILKGKEQPFVYMDTNTCWDLACARKSEDAVGYRSAVIDAPNENNGPANIMTKAKAGIDKFNSGVLKETGLQNDYAAHIVPEVILALCVQEIAPGEMPGKIKIKPKARLELFRMMCEAGWQPQKMPAIFDSAISFGLGQMTQPTHRGLQRAYNDETSDFIEPLFIRHTSTEQQINDMLLLSYANIEAFSYIAAKCPEFKKCFSTAPDDKKKRFITTVIAAYHNYGNRGSLRSRIKAVLSKEYKTLEEYRTAFIDGIKGLTIAHSHAKNSGSLYSFICNRNTALPTENIQSDPEPAIEAPDETPENDTREDTLLVRNKLPGHREKKLPFYTFTVPAYGDLEGLLSAVLVDGKKLEDVMKFQGVREYKPGSVIYIPLSFMKSDFGDRRMCIADTSGTSGNNDVSVALEKFVEGGNTDANQKIALLYGTRVGQLRFPSRLCKD